MDRTGFYVTLATMFLGLCGGLFMGLNQGIALAETHGAAAACDMLRWSIYDCSKFTH